MAKESEEVQEPGQPIKMTQEEMWAFNILNNSVTQVNDELQRAIAARDTVIKSMELFYNGTFDQSTGQFIQKKDMEKTEEK